MQDRNKIWLYLFFVFAILNLVAEYFQIQSLIYFSKPMLMITLGIYYYLQTKVNIKFSKFILLGIIAAFFGDTFLMFVEDEGHQIFFLLGLGSFLITHIFYLLAFMAYPCKEKGFVQKNLWLLLLFAGYLVGNSLYLLPDIPADLKIPVIIYSTAIILMAAAGLNLKGKLSENIFRILFAGIILFIISDTIIGLNKFKSQDLPLWNPRLLIMITYITGQYLIVKGSKKAVSILKN